jgi:hypothetical protein
LDRLIHLAHAARADQDDDFVGAEPASRSHRFFNTSGQFSTTVMGVEAGCSTSAGRVV